MEFFSKTSLLYNKQELEFEDICTKSRNYFSDRRRFTAEPDALSDLGNLRRETMVLDKSTRPSVSC